MKDFLNKTLILISKNKLETFLIVFLIVGGLIYNNYADKRWNRLMSKNTNKTFAYVTGYSHLYRGGTVLDFKYYVNGKKHESFISFKDKTLKKNDTILIKYSIEDPSVVKVIDFCYMKKHKGKEYCDN
jgi:hypothetical protein